MSEGLEGYSLKRKGKISDTELLIVCLKNAPEGTDRKQVIRLIKYYEIILARPTGPYNVFPQPDYDDTIT